MLIPTNPHHPPHHPPLQAVANSKQLAVGLAGGEVIYFELDASGALAELDKKVWTTVLVYS